MRSNLSENTAKNKVSSEPIQNPKSKIQNPFEKMDKMYRHQRYFYDLTRKYYLLGRDKLIAEMKISEGENVLEIGCGTARNLIILAEKYPQTNFFGLDASSEMLKTAQSKIDARNLKNITLKTALADDFTFNETFGLNEKFDAVFFSYAVSIIPPWKESIINALENLKADKTLYIVDFYDQAELPKWFCRLLTVWLKQFHVKYPEELLPFLEDLEKKNTVKLNVEPLYKRYSVLIELLKIVE